MADERSEYTVTIGGLEHTLLLDDDDAERYADAAVKGKTAKPANKARSSSAKS